MIKQYLLIPYLFQFTSGSSENLSNVDQGISLPHDNSRNKIANAFNLLNNANYKTLGSQNNIPIKILPIILEDFKTAINYDGRPKLEWRLSPIDEAIQINLLHSTNNINWNVLMTVNENVSGSIKNYEYYPDCEGINFYKLQIVPKSGIAINSKILPLTCSPVNSVAYPNPAKDYLVAKITGNGWRIHSADGRVWHVPAQPLGNGYVQFDLKNLPIGYYFLVTPDSKIPILHI